MQGLSGLSHSCLLCRTQDVSNVVWTAVMMGLADSWEHVIAALLVRMGEMQARGELAADAYGPAAARQLFHVRQPKTQSQCPDLYLVCEIRYVLLRKTSFFCFVCAISSHSCNHEQRHS